MTDKLLKRGYDDNCDSGSYSCVNRLFKQNFKLNVTGVNKKTV